MSKAGSTSFVVRPLLREKPAKEAENPEKLAQRIKELAKKAQKFGKKADFDEIRLEILAVLNDAAQEIDAARQAVEAAYRDTLRTILWTPAKDNPTAEEFRRRVWAAVQLRMRRAKKMTAKEMVREKET